MNLFVADPLFALNQLTLFAGVGIAGGLYLFVRGFRLLARKRLLLNTPTSKIRSAALGLVEVNGVAAGPHTLPTPIAGAQCFLYRTTAWQKSDESKTGDWKKVAEESLHVPFFLDDGTGQLLIEPSGSDLDLHCDFRQDFSDTIFSAHATPQVLSFLARHGIAPSNKIRVEEYSIRPQVPLFIVGTVAENPGIEVGTHGIATGTPSQVKTAGQPRPNTPQEVVRLSPTTSSDSSEHMTQQSKIAAALTKAGITSPAAWRAAGVPYGSPSLEPRPQVQQISVKSENHPARQDSPFNLTPPVVLMKGENNPTFLISWRSQRELVRSMGWKSAAMVWCGGALALLGIYVVLQQLALL